MFLCANYLSYFSSGAAICKKCWPLMITALKILDKALQGRLYVELMQAMINLETTHFLQSLIACIWWTDLVIVYSKPFSFDGQRNRPKLSVTVVKDIVTLFLG